MSDPLPLSLTGKVIPFKGNGRKLGYPTANISVPTALADGVYFGFADLAVYVEQPAIIFIGTPTTIGDTERRVEAYLLDIPDVDYYGDDLRLRIEQFYRSNQHFASVDELIVVMHQDEAAARRWFSEQN